MQTFGSILAVGVVCTFAYTVIGDWDRSGHMIVTMLFVLASLGIITLGVVLYLTRRNRGSTAPQSTPSAPPQLPYGRSGNVIVMPGQTAMGYREYPVTGHNQLYLID